MAERVSSHVIETKARDIVRKQIDDFYANGDALFREITERDYGIDAVVELFDKGNPTGMIGLLQIKGTERTIVPSKDNLFVSCPISVSNALYALQNNIPVLLIYVCISKPCYFYYGKIQNMITDEHYKKMEDQKGITVRIPIDNNVAENLEPFFELIRKSYM